MKDVIAFAFYGLLVVLTLGYITKWYHEELQRSTPAEIVQDRFKQIFITIPIAIVVWLLLPPEAPLIALLIAWSIVFVIFILRYRWHVASFKDGSHPWFRVEHTPEVQRKLQS